MAMKTAAIGGKAAYGRRPAGGCACASLVGQMTPLRRSRLAICILPGSIFILRGIDGATSFGNLGPIGSRAIRTRAEIQRRV
jgi:hypothetical protein